MFQECKPLLDINIVLNSEANLLMTIRDSYIASIIVNVTLHNPRIIHLVNWKYVRVSRVSFTLQAPV